jgi:hypothetical protein
MRSFSEYVVQHDFDGLARRMVEVGVDPYVHVAKYLQQQEMLSEGMIGNFFKRVGNAWRSFWGKVDLSPVDRLENAKKAVGELEQILTQNEKVDPPRIHTILNGLNQSLAMLTQLEPQVQQLEPVLAGQAQGTPMKLPPELMQRYRQIMQNIDHIMKMPDNPHKAEYIEKGDDQLDEFLQYLAQMEQNPQTPPDQREQLAAFLDTVYQNASYQAYKQAVQTYTRSKGQQ